MTEKKSIYKEWWFYFVIIVFAIVVYLLFPRAAATGLEDFATCVSESGAVMYGTEWCSHCKNQKKAFGSAFKLINYVDCDARPEQCAVAFVSGYPTWRIDSQNYPGEQSLERLSSLTGCELDS